MGAYCSCCRRFCCCRSQKIAQQQSTSSASLRVLTPRQSHAWNSPNHKYRHYRHSSDPVIPPNWMDDSKGLFIVPPRKSFEDEFIPNPLPFQVFEKQEKADEQRKRREFQFNKEVTRRRRRRRTNLLSEEEHNNTQKRPPTAKDNYDTMDPLPEVKFQRK